MLGAIFQPTGCDTSGCSNGQWMEVPAKIKPQMVTRKEKLKSKRKSNNVKNSIKLVKNRVPMNGIGICSAIKQCGFST